MKYSEKAATEILDMPQTLNNPQENLRRMIVVVEKIMQAQREADAQAAETWVDNDNAGIRYFHTITEAILNAEVKP